MDEARSEREAASGRGRKPGVCLAVTWDLRHHAIRESATFGDGKEVDHVVTTMGTRHCGCWWIIGRRLDDGEPTFGASACAEHEAHVVRAFETFSKMPPSDEVAYELWQRLLDAEVEPWTQGFR